MVGKKLLFCNGWWKNLGFFSPFKDWFPILYDSFSIMDLCSLLPSHPSSPTRILLGKSAPWICIAISSGLNQSSNSFPFFSLPSEKNMVSSYKQANVIRLTFWRTRTGGEERQNTLNDDKINLYCRFQENLGPLTTMRNRSQADRKAAARGTDLFDGESV